MSHNLSSSQAETDTTTGALSRPLVLILACACGLAAANLYYLQPLLAEISREFGVTASELGITATLTQFGYALGLLFVVSLGDIRERRGLILSSLVATAIALVLASISPNLAMLTIMSLIIGLSAVAAQVIIPMATTLAHPAERGKVIGTLMTGLLCGILLARTVSGFIGELFGWRVMLQIAAVVMLLLAVVLRLALPKSQSNTKLSYLGILRSLPSLLREEPTLREASVLGGLAFACFSIFWVTLSFFLETPPYNYGSDVAGLFGLVGVAGAFAASLIGRIADKYNPRIATGVTLLLLLLSFVILWLIGWWLPGLIVGVILLDLGVQGTQVSNQTRIYSLRPDARSRITTIYMSTYFMGGALGSLLGGFVWEKWGWNGVCTCGVILVGLALAIYWRPKRASR